MYMLWRVIWGLWDFSYSSACRLQCCWPHIYASFSSHTLRFQNLMMSNWFISSYLCCLVFFGIGPLLWFFLYHDSVSELASCDGHSETKSQSCGEYSSRSNRCHKCIRSEAYLVKLMLLMLFTSDSALKKLLNCIITLWSKTCAWLAIGLAWCQQYI